MPTASVTQAVKAGINDGCGTFVEVAVYAAPSAFVCDITASAGNWVCVIANGDVNCALPATIVLTRRNFEVAEMVAPIARCGQAAPACSNGTDDDGDGVADARDAVPTHPTDPDPGCSGPADESEDSEVGLPAGCSVGGGNLNSDPRLPAVELSGCGAVTGVWFKPSAPPSDCLFAIGAGGGQACTLIGATAGATFAATTASVVLGRHTTTDTTCGPVTIAISLAIGQVAKLRDDWC